MKICLLILLSGFTLNIENIKAEGFNLKEYFERKNIYRKCYEDETNRLIYGKNRKKYCNCYADKYMNKSIPLMGALECHADTLESIEQL